MNSLTVDTRPNVYAFYACLLATVLALVGCGASSTTTSSPGVRQQLSAEPGGRAIRLEVLWQQKIGDHSTASFRPAENGGVGVNAAGSLVVAGAESGEVVAYRTGDGSIAWQRDFNDPISGAPVLRDGRVYVSVADGHVVALNPRDGSDLWDSDLGEIINTAPVVDGGTLYVVTAREALVALNVVDGAVLWVFEHERIAELEMQGACSPLITEDAVFLGFSDGSLFRLSKEGALVWAVDLAEGHHRFRDADATPRLVNGSLIASSFAGGLHARDPETGEPQWHVEVQGAGTAHVLDSRLVVATNSGRIVWYDAQNGEEQHTLSLDTRGMSTFVDSDGLLFVSTSARGVYVIDEATPWIHTTFDPNGGVNAPVAIAGDRVFVLSNHGYVYGLRLAR